MSETALVIDVFSDVVCPWCLVGAARLKNAAAALQLPVTLRYQTFFLDPTTPEEGHDVAAMLQQKYGAEPGPMFARVVAEAKKSGVDLDLKKQPRSYPTQRAHVLLRAALEKGTQSAFADALFSLHFIEGGIINDPDTLVALSTAYGFDADEARALLSDAEALAETVAAAAEAHAAGVRGVPLYVFGELGALSGAQPEEVFVEVLTQAAAAAGIDVDASAGAACAV